SLSAQVHSVWVEALLLTRGNFSPLSPSLVRSSALRRLPRKRGTPNLAVRHLPKLLPMTISKPIPRSLLPLFLFLLIPPGFTVAAPIDDLQQSFLNPPDDTRIMMRWWWFGPAVTKAELEREMRLMKEGGIGGFEVQPVYPLVLDDPEKGIKTLPF